jgi:alcohol dehydrogenase/L-iditol 2-dehydrogenase
MTLSLQRRGVAVCVLDLNEARVAFLSAALGATAATDEDERFAFIVDTTGLPEAMAEAIRRSEVGATILELGLERRPLELDAETLVRRQLCLRGSLTYDHPEDFRFTTALVNDGVVVPGRVVSHEVPLADAQRAFELGREAPGKTWVRVSGGV